MYLGQSFLCEWVAPDPSVSMGRIAALVACLLHIKNRSTVAPSTLVSNEIAGFETPAPGRVSLLKDGARCLPGVISFDLSSPL